MDLIIEIKDFQLCYQRVAMSFVHVFLTNKFNESIECNIEYALDRDGMMELIAFLESKDFGEYGGKQMMIDQLTEATASMSKKEKAYFRFW